MVCVSSYFADNEYLELLAYSKACICEHSCVHRGVYACPCVCSMYVSLKPSVLPSLTAVENWDSKVPPLKPLLPHSSGPAFSEGLCPPGLGFQGCENWCPPACCSHSVAGRQAWRCFFRAKWYVRPGTCVAREATLSQRTGEDGWNGMTWVEGSEQWSANSLCERPHFKYFRFSGQHGLYCNYSTLPL